MYIIYLFCGAESLYKGVYIYTSINLHIYICINLHIYIYVYNIIYTYIHLKGLKHINICIYTNKIIKKGSIKYCII